MSSPKKSDVTPTTEKLDYESVQKGIDTYLGKCVFDLI